MKRTNLILLSLGLIAGGSSSASAENLYGISFFGNEIIEISQETGLGMSAAKLSEPLSPYGIAVYEGKLYTFNPTTDRLVELDIHTGTPSATFDVRITDTQGEGDLAFRSDGVGFLASALDEEANPVNELYSFDLTNKTSTLIGTTDVTIDAMAFDGDNVLYALGQGEGELYVIDPDTAETTSIGSLSIPQNSPFAAMAFSPEGVLYAVIDDRLHIIDTTTGAAQPVDEATLDLNFSSVSGLAFFDPPAARFLLQISKSGSDQITLTWPQTLDVVLETSADLQSPFVEADDQSNPQTFPATEMRHFFRLAQ